jgi:hypothetical protein
MAEINASGSGGPESAGAPAAGLASAPRSSDEVALELMRFIALQTGYGRSSHSAAGFSGKPAARSPEEHADALLELFQRCRKAVKQEA